jgi:cytochrome c oxidase subunit 2
MNDDQANATGPQNPARGSFFRVFLIWLVLTVIGELLFWFLSSNFVAWGILPPAASNRSPDINGVMAIFTYLSIPTFLLVVVFAIYAAATWGARRRPALGGAARLVNGRFIPWWIGISLLLVTFLYVDGLVTLSRVDAKPAGDVLQVNVTGEQWLWDYSYPQYNDIGGSELELVVGRPTTFTINSMDVQHSFWIPAFDIKEDAVPGETTTISVTPTQVGDYQVRCAELCGIYHSYMETPVHVVTQAQFDAWAAKQLPAAAPTVAPSSLIQHATSAYIREPDRLLVGLARG